MLISLFILQAEYFEKNPKGLNPVQLNDIVFSVHAACVTLFTLSQFLIYEVSIIECIFTISYSSKGKIL